MGHTTATGRLPASHWRPDKSESSEAVRVRIGHRVTLLEDDGNCRLCLITDAKCAEAVGRAVGDPGAVVTTREPLGRAIFNGRAGERRWVEDPERARWVWIQAIAPGPVFTSGTES